MFATLALREVGAILGPLEIELLNNQGVDCIQFIGRSNSRDKCATCIILIPKGGDQIAEGNDPFTSIEDLAKAFHWRRLD